jgi:2-dehydropantoate 2-reductase
LTSAADRRRLLLVDRWTNEADRGEDAVERGGVVVVVGAGQMGSIYGAAARDNGHEVWFVDAVPEIVQAINDRGLIIDRRDGRTDTYRVPATRQADDLPGAVEVILFQTKGWATRDAARNVASAAGPETAILTLQNGLGNEEVLREVFPANAILIGMSVHTVVTVDVAHYAHTGVRDTHLGPTGQASPETAERVAALFRRDDFPVEVLDEQGIRTAQWGKFVLNCASLPTMALTRLPTAAANGHELVFAHMDEVTRETCAIARAAGIELDTEERVAFQHDLFRTAGGRASMLGDVLAHRRTEVDTINGAALMYAERHGVPAPLNRALYALVKGLETAIEMGEA